MLMLKLALRNLARNRRRTILTGLSMLGGYLLLALSLSIANGSYDNMIDLFTKDQSGHIQLNGTGYLERPTLSNTIERPRHLLAALDTLPAVTASTLRLQAGALAYGGERALPVELWGIDVAREVKTTLLGSKIKAGSLPGSQPDGEGYYQALIGHGVATRLKLGVGDELVLIGQGADGSLANDIYLVSGIVGTKDSAERMRVILPLPAAEDFLALHNHAHAIVVQTNNFKRAETNARLLHQAFDSPKLEVSPWQVVEKEFYATMEADKQGNNVTILVVVVLVSLGVLNTVLMSTLERTGEFGVLKAIGTSPQRLFVMIQLETLLMALGSCLFGALLALPIIYYFATTGIALPEPVEVAGMAMDAMKGTMSLNTFLFPALVIWLAAQVVALVPAWRSARLVPVDAMRSL